MAFQFKDETLRFIDAAEKTLKKIRDGVELENRGEALKGAEDLRREAWSIHNNVGLMR